MNHFEIVAGLSACEAREAMAAVLDVQRFDVEWETTTTAYATSSGVWRLLFIGWFSALQVRVAITIRSRNSRLANLQLARLYAFQGLGVLASTTRETA